MIGRDQPLHRDRSQIGDQEAVACFERVGGRRREAVAEAGGAVGEPEENQFGRRAERARFLEREQRLVGG